jgi:hypothetical protein
MKMILAALLVPALLGVGACAESVPAGADPDAVEAAVNEANEQAAMSKKRNKAP